MAFRRRYWWPWRRSIFSFLLVSTCWTLVGRWVSSKPILDQTWTQSRTQQLQKTMEAFKQLRIMLNQRLLATGVAKTEENFKFSDDTELEESMENHRRNFVLLATMDELDDSRHFLLKRAEQEPNKPRRGNRDRQQRRHRQRMRMMNKNQRKQEERREEELEEMMQSDGAFLTQIQDSPHLQPESSLETLRLAQRQKDESRLLANSAKNDFECPKLHGKSTQVLCPSRRRGYRVCIPDIALCNGHADCPLAEDEDPVNCLFYKTTIHHFRLIVDAVVELSDVVKKHENKHGMDEL